MPDPTHALRFAIQLAEAEGFPECAAGLRVALDRLTQPSDIQADLTERARECYAWIERWQRRYSTTPGHTHAAECILYFAHIMEATERRGQTALQSEREAAAAEARRAAIEECAKYAESQYHMNSFHVAIGIRALASPAPQEETR